MTALFSREFWRAFADYWSVREVGHRIDKWVSRTREQTDQEPDWDVERRLAKRRTEDLDGEPRE